MAQSHSCVNARFMAHSRMTKRTPQTQDKYVLRLPDGMRDRIKAAAEANNRSMNAEIVATLEEYYPGPAVLTFAEIEEAIDNLEEIVERGQSTNKLRDLLERFISMKNAMGGNRRARIISRRNGDYYLEESASDPLSNEDGA